MVNLIKKLKKLKVELTFGCGPHCIGCTVKKETGLFKKADKFIRDNMGRIKLITHADWMGIENPIVQASIVPLTKILRVV